MSQILVQRQEKKDAICEQIPIISMAWNIHAEHSKDEDRGGRWPCGNFSTQSNLYNCARAPLKGCISSVFLFFCLIFEQNGEWLTSSDGRIKMSNTKIIS